MTDMAWLLPVFGFVVGIFASLTGVGGGVLIFPILTLLYGFVPQQAVGTSLGMIIFTAIASTYFYSRQKRIFYRTGLLLSITTVPGAYLGAYLTTIVSPQTLGVLFGLFLIYIAGRMILRSLKPGGTSAAGGDAVERPSVSDRELVASRGPAVKAVTLGLFVGIASGLLGIGGGALAVPIMTLVLHMPIHYATATSMFTMIFTSLSGVLKHHLAGHVHWLFAVLLGAGTVFGARLGASLSLKISGRNLRLVFGIVLLAVSVEMIVKYL
jgi:uncharacterized membrane protein YfcA